MMNGNALVWFSPLSILLGLAISVLQLYVTSRQAKLKEVIIELFRKELSDELKVQRTDMMREVDYKIEIAKGAIINELNRNRN